MEQQRILKYQSSASIGSYEATGNGYNDVTAFLDDPDRTGAWFGANGHPEVFPEPDIWSDLGVGKTILHQLWDSINDVYQFVDLSDLDYPVIAPGTIFGVVRKSWLQDRIRVELELGSPD
ncbi:MAG: hypothetical protein U5J96_17405 [Ignavibacteriaceae bacterium]|nr:hypothetical protein [Ignavibacteriaceae bacterium]